MATFASSGVAVTLQPKILLKLKGYIALTKPRIIELLLITTVPTMFLAKDGIPSLELILITVLGGTLAAGGANAFNMVIDRDIDAKMERTKGRPLVTKVLRPVEATFFAVILEVAAFVVFWAFVNLLSGILAVSAMAFYVGVYTVWLKRRSTQNIVIGGAAGAVPVLIGWSAVTDKISLVSVLLAFIIFLWTPPHFWALAVKYKEDYRAANVPMLPTVKTNQRTANEILIYSILVVALSVALIPLSSLKWAYAGSAVLSGLGLIGYSLLFKIRPSSKNAMKLFGFSITYLTIIFLSIAVDVLIFHR